MMNFIKIIRSRWKNQNNRNGIYCRRVSELLILSIKCQMSRQYPDEQQCDVWCVVNLNRKFHACVWFFLTFSNFPTLAPTWQVTLAHSSFLKFYFCILKNAVNPVNNHGSCNKQTCRYIVHLLSLRIAITGISTSRQFKHLTTVTVFQIQF